MLSSEFTLPAPHTIWILQNYETYTRSQIKIAWVKNFQHDPYNEREILSFHTIFTNKIIKQMEGIYKCEIEQIKIEKNE
jgi:uncharacterized protein YqjF (DUF2071 family)